MERGGIGCRVAMRSGQRTPSRRPVVQVRPTGGMTVTRLSRLGPRCRDGRRPGVFLIADGPDRFFESERAIDGIPKLIPPPTVLRSTRCCEYRVAVGIARARFSSSTRSEGSSFAFDRWVRIVLVLIKDGIHVEKQGAACVRGKGETISIPFGCEPEIRRSAVRTLDALYPPTVHA
jgi:hypothetical protein